MVAAAPPSTQQVIASVARAGCGASAKPVRALIANSVELFAKSIAWHAASSATLRRVLFIYTVLGLELQIVGAAGHVEGRQKRNHLHARGAFLHPGPLRDRGARGVR